jgi:hypothetical protein
MAIGFWFISPQKIKKKKKNLTDENFNEFSVPQKFHRKQNCKFGPKNFKI